ncbi:MAG: VWA domain-containing protein [Candidatus Aminicenantes bacterium]|nr:MAG: VWA domain-containing protein [Candidatus Aminicenantes bacterium]
MNKKKLKTKLFILILSFFVLPVNHSLANSVEPVVEIDHPVVMNKELTPIYALVQFKVAKIKEDPEKPRPSLNLALVIDRSGSMGERGKLVYAKKAAGILVDNLKATDLLAVVEYDDRITVLWPKSPVESPEMIKKQINLLFPRGSTNLTGGMMKGVDEVLKKIDKNSLNRVILLSDGLANRGITNPVEIKDLVREAKRKGVYISTMGLGANYDEDLLQAIAENAASNYYYIESPTQMNRIFQQEMSILFTTVAKDVKMTYVMSKDVKKIDVFGFPFKQEENELEIEQEDFYSGESRALLLRMNIEPQKPGKMSLGNLNLSYKDITDNKAKTIEKDIFVTVIEDAEKVKQGINKKVVAEAALLESEKEHEDYVRLYEKGKMQESLKRIKDLIQKLKDKNSTLGDVRISKKIEALEMETEEMKQAEKNRLNRAVYLKKSKQRFYKAKKGKRGKYILQEGDEGIEVERLQMVLLSHGLYNGPVDGKFTAQLTEAVKKFQEKNNLKPDGIVGPATMKALGLY